MHRLFIIMFLIFSIALATGYGETRSGLAELSVGSSLADTEFKLVFEGDGRECVLSRGSYSGQPGEYTLTASKWGYYTQQKTFTLRQNDIHTVNFRMEPLPLELMNSKSKARFSSYAAITTLAVSLGTSLYLYNKADEAFKNYEAATEPPSASTWRKSFEKYQLYYNITLGVDIIPATWWLISSVRGLSAKSKIRSEMNTRIGEGGN